MSERVSEMSRKNERLHVAVLIANSGDACQNTIIDGINDCAHKYDIDISAYIGAYQTMDNEYVSHYETCYEIIKNSKSLDGLIILTGFITPEEGFETFAEEIVQTFMHIPTVSVSYHIPGMPSVLADNESGIYSIVDHLIKDHDKEKIAFIRGPKGHLEAEERLAGYKRALSANSINFDEQYILPGNFTQIGGNEAIKELIEVRKLPYDAVVASDDATAFGAINELKSRGVSVPKDVSVTGFDDDRVATTFTPSLTTVKQNFRQIGETSAETLVSLIKNEPVENKQYIDGRFISRQSCGCLCEEFLQNKAIRDDSWKNSDCLNIYVLKEFELLFIDYIPKEQLAGWVDVLVGCIKSKPFMANDFYKAFDGVLIEYSLRSNDYLKWFEALDAITAGVGAYSSEVENLNTILSSLVNTTKLVQDACLKFVKEMEYELIEARQKLSRTASALVLTHDLDSLSYELSKALPLLSLDFAIVGLYENNTLDSINNSKRDIETIFGFSKGRIINFKCNGKRTELHTLIEKYNIKRERQTQCIFPLFSKDDEMGILFLPYNNNIPTVVYESVRMSISSAVKGIQLLTRIKDLSVTDELTGLLNRRGFFQFAHSRLQHLQRNFGLTPLVMFFDIDGLKRINDNFGHKEGDLAIATFAKILRKTLRGEDIIGRMGGDEFVALTSVKSGRDGKKLEKRIRESFVKLNEKNRYKFKLDSSIGIVALEEPTIECFDDAMLRADSVLYEEKRKKKEGITP